MSRPFTWFPPETTEKLRQELNDAGPGARLEIHGHWHEQTLHVSRRPTHSRKPFCWAW